MTARLFLHIFSLEARKLMSYRVDFWLNSVFGFAAHFSVVYFLWQAIYQESGATVIRGWSFEMMLLYYVLVILIGKMVRGAEHLGDIATDIYEGGLTRYIIYPTSYVLFKYAQHLGNVVPALVQLALFASLYGLLLAVPADAHISAASIGMAAVSIVLGNMLFYAFMAPLQSVAFWADNVWSLNVMFRFSSNLLGGAMLPLSLFPDWGQQILGWLPFQHLYYIPVSVLIGQMSPLQWLQSLALGICWLLFALGAYRLIWNRGKFAYTGVGI